MASGVREKGFSKMHFPQLRNKAQEFLASRRNADNLVDILQLFELEAESYMPALLAIELIFVEILQRGDLKQHSEISAKSDDSPEAVYTNWLRQCYENAWNVTLASFFRGKNQSRVQAVVTAMKLMAAEGKYPINPFNEYHFPIHRIQDIFSALLNSEELAIPQIQRFQEFTEYSDITQFGLKVLSVMGYKKLATPVYILNYLELLDKLASDVPHDKTQRANNEEEQKVLCVRDGQNFGFNVIQCRRYVNRCWSQACQWNLCSDTRVHKRCLLLLVEKLMPLLNKPQLATDLLMDSLDAGGAVSMLALQGVLELVRRHNIDYPDIYDRLYSMFEPEMFATRYKQRLIHLADIFLSSTHLPEALVAAFAKRLSRLALVAPPEDTARLLQLVANILHRHPGLKRMICTEEAPAIMSTDPYVMEESTPSASQALSSSLWEVAALQQHWLPGVSSAASRVLAAVDTRQDQPVDIPVTEDDAIFDAELKKKFKSIEMNFIRPNSMYQPSGERLLQYWNVIG